MKWLLIYEFDVEIYRRAPTIRIFLEDVLLNEIILNQNTIGVIEFDYIPKDKNKLTVEFINDDNNYSNGFMSRATYITPKLLTILPLTLIQNIKKLPEKIFRHEINFSRDNYYIYRCTGVGCRILKNKFIKGYEYIKHYYKRRTGFPESLSESVFGEASDLYNKLYNNTNYNFHETFTYSKSEKFDFILYKKHNTLILNKTLGYWRVHQLLIARLKSLDIIKKYMNK